MCLKIQITRLLLHRKFGIKKYILTYLYAVEVWTYDDKAGRCRVHQSKKLMAPSQFVAFKDSICASQSVDAATCNTTLTEESCSMSII